MRTMIKWKPFNSLLNSECLKEIENNMKKSTKPIIMEDTISEINNTLISAITHKKEIEIKYFHISTLKTLTGKIDKVNQIEKYILINKTRIYFSSIINVNLL